MTGIEALQFLKAKKKIRHIDWERDWYIALRGEKPVMSRRYKKYLDYCFQSSMPAKDVRQELEDTMLYVYKLLLIEGWEIVE